jgi:integrase/recombinase XerD
MKQFNAENERIKRQYFEFLKQADGKADASIQKAGKAISRYESETEFADFKRFNTDKAIVFKKALSAQNLAKATILSTMGAVKKFFGWLSCQSGYKSRIQTTDIEYLNMSEKDVRAAQAPSDQPFPTLEQIKRTIMQMPAQSDIERRDRALIAFTLVTGMRDGATISLRIKHVNVERLLVIQNPKQVMTKSSKRIDAFFFPVGNDIEKIVLDWVGFLKVDKLFGNDDPLFPKTEMGQDENECFIATGLSKEFWSSASPMRSIFKRAFNDACLPNFGPHSFRRTLVQFGYDRCTTPEQFKAWSQNLGHESPLTTFASYGRIDLGRQGQLIRGSNPSGNDAPATKADLDALFKKMLLEK